MLYKSERMDIDPVQRGLALAWHVAGAEAGAVLLAENGKLAVRAERMWGTSLLDGARSLWTLAQADVEPPQRYNVRLVARHRP